MSWLESHLYLKLTQPRPPDYQVFNGEETYPEIDLLKYAKLSDRTWESIQDMDLLKLTECVNQTRRIQQDLIPGYVSDSVSPELDSYQSKGMGCKLMGAGGFGYIMIVAENQPEGSEKIVIRRQSLTL